MDHEGGRTTREYHYTNSDGEEGVVEVSFGPWATEGMGEAPVMVTFDDARWMGVEEAEGFLRWFRTALAEAKRKHVPSVEA